MKNTTNWYNHPCTDCGASSFVFWRPLFRLFLCGECLERRTRWTVRRFTHSQRGKNHVHLAF